MEKKSEQLLDILESVWQEADYQELVREYEIRSVRLIGQLRSMNQPQRDAVMDYCGLLIELHIKILEYALSRSEK